ncbi:MAG: hypothetical protein JRN21_10055 [Nitrososphaerota archaeon]|nr:hypothetical protein [Nitrososphaerota archaeon]
MPETPWGWIIASQLVISLSIAALVLGIVYNNMLLSWFGIFPIFMIMAIMLSDDQGRTRHHE